MSYAWARAVGGQYLDSANFSELHETCIEDCKMVKIAICKTRTWGESTAWRPFAGRNFEEAQDRAHVLFADSDAVHLTTLT